MTGFIRSVAVAAGVTGALVTAALVVPSGSQAATTTHAHPAMTGSVNVCAKATKGHAACMSRVAVAGATPLVSKLPSGYGPSDIQSAYELKGAKSTATVAIVDAYDDPTAEADLASYRSTYGLPACTTANGCFKKVNQTGGTAYPPTDSGWALEISLDLDMVSATCKKCHILLVEATDNSYANLASAVNYAATQGVASISNSYGGGENSPNSAYNHPGIAITASSGDGGYGVESPASYPDVIGVGGTSLTPASNSRGWTETAWSGAGSGCTTLAAKPSWQSGTSCKKKAIADVSAVADPNTGVAVYDTTPYEGESGWFIVGGTSASSPIIASVYALGGNLSGYPASYTWAHSSNLHDVKSGSNGSCSPAVLCTAGVGWDGPTGLGTPNGINAF